jgi:hypothetical protein
MIGASSADVKLRRMVEVRSEVGERRVIRFDGSFPPWLSQNQR